MSVAVLLVALRLYQANLAAIIGWPHREVQPDGAVAILGRAKRRSRALLYQQFVKVLVRFVADVEQDSRIADELFHILHPDIHRTPSKVVAGWHATYLLIQLRRSVAAVDDYRSSCARAQNFQPSAKVSEVGYCFVTWDVIHFRMRITLRELPERKVLGEFCITIQLYYWFHFSLLMLIF